MHPKSITPDKSLLPWHLAIFALAALFLLTFSVAVSAQEATKENTADQNITIGVEVPILNNPFWIRAREFSNYVADKLNIKIVFLGANGSGQNQLRDIRSLISRGWMPWS